MPYCVTIGITSNIWNYTMKMIEWLAVVMITLFGSLIGTVLGVYYIFVYEATFCPTFFPSLL
tara:strand:- start:491 stop:676 length:186 start_codon:yes stop_codon:yes gene_type:complete